MTGPDLGKFSVPRQSRFVKSLRSGITIQLPTLNIGLVPSGFPRGGA